MTDQLLLPHTLAIDTVNFSDVLATMTASQAVNINAVYDRACDLVGIGSAADDTPAGYFGERQRRYLKAARHTGRYSDQPLYLPFYRLTPEQATPLDTMRARITEQFLQWEPTKEDFMCR